MFWCTPCTRQRLLSTTCMHNIAWHHITPIPHSQELFCSACWLRPPCIRCTFEKARSYTPLHQFVHGLCLSGFVFTPIYFSSIFFPFPWPSFFPTFGGTGFSCCSVLCKFLNNLHFWEFLDLGTCWGVGGNPRIIAKRDPSVSNSAWKAFLRWTWTSIFTTWKLGFLNISEYPARYGIEMDPAVTARRWQSGKKHVLCMLGLLSTIIRGRERSDQESVIHEKIALAHEHNWAPITSTSAREVARTSARRLGHPARAVFF